MVFRKVSNQLKILLYIISTRIEHIPSSFCFIIYIIGKNKSIAIQGIHIPTIEGYDFSFDLSSSCINLNDTFYLILS
jgi:hypothetical protein